MNSLYLLCHRPFFFMVKVGIARNVRQRQKSINRSLKFGKTWHICSVKIPLALRWEKFIHHLFFWCRSSWLGGSGKTEWFFVFPAVIMLPFVVLSKLFRWVLILGLILLAYKLLQGWEGSFF